MKRKVMSDYQVKKKAIARHEAKLNEQGYTKIQIRCHKSVKEMFSKFVSDNGFKSSCEALEYLLEVKG